MDIIKALKREEAKLEKTARNATKRLATLRATMKLFGGGGMTGGGIASEDGKGAESKVGQGSSGEGQEGSLSQGHLYGVFGSGMEPTLAGQRASIRRSNSSARLMDSVNADCRAGEGLPSSAESFRQRKIAAMTASVRFRPSSIGGV